MQGNTFVLKYSSRNWTISTKKKTYSAASPISAAKQEIQ